MKVYTSTYPRPHLPQCSVFTYLFSGPNFASTASKTAFIDTVTGRSISRGELKDLALQWGHGLTNAFPALPQGGVKVKRGDTVMIFSPNSLAFPVLLHGSIAAGLKVTLANSSYVPYELGYQYKDSGAKLIFAHPALLPVALKMFGEVYGAKGREEARKRIIIAGGSGWGSVSAEEERKLAGTKEVEGLVWMQDLLGEGALQKEEQFSGLEVNETAYLCYSSGTTGRPKGVETTHYNVTSHAEMLNEVWDLKSGNDVMLGFLPFYHIFGLTGLLHHPLTQNAPLAIMPGFNPEAWCVNVQKYKITCMMVVPPVLVVLTNYPALGKYDLTSLNLMISGAAPLGAGLVKKVKDRLHSVGATTDITQGYGLTETTPVAFLLPPKDCIRKVGSVGRLVPHLEARLLSEEDVDIDETKEESGELWLRGPSIMKGYLNNVEATQNSITRDGWFKTGDVAQVDEDGYWYIVDRRKELIKYKGFQVPPAELEQMLIQHPEIADVAVIGVESVEEATEVPRAYIVHVNPKSVQSQQDKDAFEKKIQEWVRGRVAKHKYLRGGVAIIDVIPKNPSGKILRRVLRDRAKTEVTAIKAKAKL
ncbi:acetyl-CoA synthetase-like protein [Gloeophyllum trabeum ATCC 11539]|uniref:Acetyl-CoA synthetase-like protein n=1 Tax=Gloeophyllum trabeum (strain ATCC 11539 / FP-39264 / Madison 617) TaxID=670483 RepID=S7RFQ3_GLOTA|nr:acetyl-CoA synthetase-like protein [Gloeophyllum trabeum ATCC 11539]EPQ51344.1 acetyl-CoA synthetase-like protein [Gloeophyllum trabeum ATCC 11539]